MSAVGGASLTAYLVDAYNDGASLEQLARTTGLGRDRLRAAMASAGIDVRPTGVNTSDGKRSRARQADQAAAERVGTTDLRRWLTDQFAGGATLSELGRRVGHSSHWVRWRALPGESPT